MGTPLIFGLFGNDGVFIMNGFVTVFNLFVWTHGVILMSGNNGKEKNIVGSLLKAFRAPATIAVAAGLLCLFTGIRLPEIMTSALTNVAEMTTPLAMIVAGVSIMSAGIIKSIRNPRVYLTAAVRLLLFPAIGFAIIMFMPCEIMPKLITLIEFSCPVAAMGTMFAIRYEQNAEYSSQIFAVSTLLSAVTLPMIVKLGSIVLEAISTV
ncbi:MAG: AEC family transporter [Ruminiclostridium sp.]|nr:AEC family transporter [Ruminiclostridium sp.]